MIIGILPRSVAPDHTFPNDTRSFAIAGILMPVPVGDHGGPESTFIDAVCDAMKIYTGDVPVGRWNRNSAVTPDRLEEIRALYILRGWITTAPSLGHTCDTWTFYHEDVPVTGFVPGLTNNTGYDSATENVMQDANNDIGKGFAERTAALEMTIFTNAQDGAALYVHGLQPATQQHILRLEDTYVSVCTEKTYILQNDLEGAYANACSGDVMEASTMTASSTQRIEDNPRNNMGGDGDYTATMGTSTAGLNVHAGAATDKAYATWLRLHNQSQHLFEVKMSTKAPRLIVVNLGIANLARYTEGEYTNTLTFTLMPIVG
ncbi:hypothetical protein HY792_06780 [Candidatus Desantisbacteria bacterium]|nr:hypothetical protein [Candidatus Desantisbacteria bacterium]